MPGGHLRWPFGSVASRMMLVLCLGIVVSQLVSMGAFHANLIQELGFSDERQLARRVAAAVQAIDRTPASGRERVAASMSGLGVEVQWNREAMLPPAAPITSDKWLVHLMEQLRAVIGTDAPAYDLRATSPDEASGAPNPMFRASIRLPDNSWVNSTATALGHHPVHLSELLVSTSLMAFVVIVLGMFMVQLLTAPLRALAQAAERLGLDVGAAQELPETGPEDVRKAAHAFNEMQRRIRKLVSDRTQTFAAISHDLKTPITRLKLRTEFVEDDEQRERMVADIAEMEAMIASTLAFLREDAAAEKEAKRIVDLAAVLATICNDMSDAGYDVTLDAPVHAPLTCRPLALKRALTNLIDNAVKYGNNAAVRLTAQENFLKVDIDDEGPGVPEAEFEKVFDPFYRMEISRNRATGGSGLGLTVARAAIQAHGGDIELSNRQAGGLRVSVRLPRAYANS